MSEIVKLKCRACDEETETTREEFVGEYPYEAQHCVECGGDDAYEIGELAEIEEIANATRSPSNPFDFD